MASLSHDPNLGSLHLLDRVDIFDTETKTWSCGGLLGYEWVWEYEKIQGYDKVWSYEKVWGAA